MITWQEVKVTPVTKRKKMRKLDYTVTVTLQL
jgi:hypothetical protein